MDETIERNELKKENPAPLAEESISEAVEAAPGTKEAAQPEAAPSECEAPAGSVEESGPEDKAAPPAEEDADAPLVMPAPADSAASFAMPEVPAPAPIPAGPAEKLFSGLSYVGLPVLLLFAAAMSFLEVWQIRDLWFADEVRLAEAFANMKNGDWLVLTLNGQTCADTPPLYFWFMDALTRIPGLPVSMPMALFLAAAVSHALFIGSIWVLARGTGFDRRVAFASGLVALSCVYISGTAASPRADLLFAALATLGMTCLYRGWIKSFAPFWLAAGWLLLAAATLTKSPLGIAFAVVSSIIFLFWRGTPGRLNSRDGLPGFFLMLLAIAGWLGMLYLDGHTGYIRSMVEGQLYSRILGGGDHWQLWWYYLAALPIIWVPWILLPLFVNWLRALRGIPAAVRTRKTDGGSSWLWIWLVTGVALLSCVHAKAAVYALPLLAPLAVLTARSLLKLTAGRSRCFFGLSAAILAVAGLALVLIDVYPFVKEYAPADWLAYIPACMLPWLEALEGTMYMGAVLIVTAVALLSLTRLALPGGSLLVTALGMMLMFQPYHWFVTPSMTKILSSGVQTSVKAEPAAPAAEAVPAAPEVPAPAEPAPAEPAPAETPEAPAPEAAPEEKAPEAQPEAAPAAEAPADVKA
ncbi:MAG: hypothetical protein IJD65_03835 [Mailhella sp.]|nr:hypothetical protein [Mailhella sp.]